MSSHAREMGLLRALPWQVKYGLVAFVIFLMALVSYNPRLYVGVVGFLTLPLAVAYPILYSRLPWKHSPTGRALMSMARAVALLYVVGLAGRIKEWPFHGYAMAVVTTYLGVAIGYQLWVMLRLKIDARPASQPIEVSDDRS